MAQLAASKQQGDVDRDQLDFSLQEERERRRGAEEKVSGLPNGGPERSWAQRCAAPPPPVPVSPCLCLSVSRSPFCLPVSLSVSMCVCASGCLWLCVCACLSACLCVCPSVCVCVCVSVRLCVCPSVCRCVGVSVARARTCTRRWRVAPAAGGGDARGPVARKRRSAPRQGAHQAPHGRHTAAVGAAPHGAAGVAPVRLHTSYV